MGATIVPNHAEALKQDIVLKVWGMSMTRGVVWRCGHVSGPMHVSFTEKKNVQCLNSTGTSRKVLGVF